MSPPRARAVRVAAQAKVNLFLRVLAREAWGYHQIETLFCRLDLADEVMVRISDGHRSLDALGEDSLGPVEDNLAWRAAAGYAARTGWPRGFTIELTKHIPVGGGLGGGSADAGAVLRALDEMAPSRAPREILLELACSLGADVPFLTLDVPRALAWGRGERLLSLPALPKRSVVLLRFPFGVPTADAYRWLGESRGRYDPTVSVIDPDQLGSWEAIARLARNDFEPAVPERFAPIDAALRTLRAPAARTALGPHGFALLCGSGATVCAVSAATDSLSALAEQVAGVVGATPINTSTATRVEEVEVVE